MIRFPLAPVESLADLSDTILARLRASLAQADYLDSILEFTEGILPGMFDHLRLPLVRRALERRGDEAAQLARLFAYDDAVDAGIVRKLIDPETSDALLRAGGLVLDPERNDQIRSAFRLVPTDGLWILSDRLDAGGECVMGPGPTTLQLLRMLPRTPAGSVLDMGCGAGTIALAAAARGNAVIGTDVNPRAVCIARFNARLNGLAADFRCGDLLEPVKGNRFSLILAQLPYVAQPPGVPSAVYLHGGAQGDEISLRLISEIPAALEPGGCALILMDAAARKGEVLSNRLRSFLRDAPIDLVVLAAPGASSDLQSIGYAMVHSPDLGDDFVANAWRYRDHMDAAGVEEFRHCLVILRAGDGGTPAGGRFTVQLRVRSLPGREEDALGRVLAPLDLAAMDDVSLTRQSVRPAPRARWIEERPRPDPRVEPTYSVRFPADSYLLDQDLGQAGYTLMGLLDEAGPIDEAILRYAEICDAQPDEVRRSILDFVREGLSRGLLVPDGLEDRR